MTIEPLMAFYNTELGAVSAGKDIEVDDALGTSLITQGLAIQIGSGGGGGDYNVANVTVVGDGGSFSLESYTNDAGMYPCIFQTDDGFNYSAYADDGVPATYKLVYTGESAVVYPYNVVKGVTGDVVYDSDTGSLTITGDCTVSGFSDD